VDNKETQKSFTTNNKTNFLAQADAHIGTPAGLA
jgi:hypothetical protein